MNMQKSLLLCTMQTLEGAEVALFVLGQIYTHTHAHNEQCPWHLTHP